MGSSREERERFEKWKEAYRSWRKGFRSGPIAIVMRANNYVRPDYPKTGSPIALPLYRFKEAGLMREDGERYYPWGSFGVTDEAHEKYPLPRERLGWTDFIDSFKRRRGSVLNSYFRLVSGNVMVSHVAIIDSRGASHHVFIVQVEDERDSVSIEYDCYSQEQIADWRKKADEQEVDARKFFLDESVTKKTLHTFGKFTPPSIDEIDSEGLRYNLFPDPNTDREKWAWRITAGRRLEEELGRKWDFIILSPADDWLEEFPLEYPFFIPPLMFYQHGSKGYRTETPPYYISTLSERFYLVINDHIIKDRRVLMGRSSHPCVLPDIIAEHFIKIEERYELIDAEIARRKAETLRIEKERLRVIREEKLKQKEERLEREREQRRRHNRVLSEANEALFGKCPNIGVYRRIVDDNLTIFGAGIVPIKRAGRGYDYKVILMWWLQIEGDLRLQIKEEVEEGLYEILHITEEKSGFFIDDTKAETYTFNVSNSAGGGTWAKSKEIFRVSSSDMEHVDLKVLRKLEEAVKKEENEAILKGRIVPTWPGRFLASRFGGENELNETDILLLSTTDYQEWYTRYVQQAIDKAMLFSSDSRKYLGFGEWFSCRDGEFIFDFTGADENYRDPLPFMVTVDLTLQPLVTGALRYIIGCGPSYSYGSEILIFRVSSNGEEVLLPYKEWSQEVGGHVERGYNHSGFDSVKDDVDFDFSHYIIDYDNGRCRWGIQKGDFLDVKLREERFGYEGDVESYIAAWKEELLKNEPLISEEDLAEREDEQRFKFEQAQSKKKRYRSTQN